MNENQEEKDRLLRKKISDAVIGPGFQPKSVIDAEAMLDAFEGDELTEDQVSRILDKAMRRLPIGERESDLGVSEAASEDEVEELLALHRGAGENISDDVKDKLDALRRKAEQEQQEENDLDDELET